MAPARQPLAQRFVFTQLQNRVHDSERVDFGQHPCFLAVANETADVGVRQNHGPSHGEEFRELAGQAKFVEGVVRARLHQHIREAEDGRDFLVTDMAQLDGNPPGPFFIRPQEWTKIAAGPDQARGSSFAVQNGSGEIKAANVASVRGMDIAGVAKNGGPLRDAELLEESGDRAAAERRAVRRRPARE